MSAQTARAGEQTRRGKIDYGRPILLLRNNLFSGYWDKRSITTALVLAIISLACFITALRTGDYTLTSGEVLDALLGKGDPGQELVVRTWRLPRAIAALGLGAALGVSGAVFQTLTRNPLGSPDVIGFNSGAFAGATAIILYTQATFVTTALGAFLGGMATAFAVYLLSRVNGTFRSFRLIIIGIAVSAMLSSLTTWMIVNADIEQALQVSLWGAGSLNGVTAENVYPAVAMVLLSILLLSFLLPAMRLSEMGDELATTLGGRLSLKRPLLIVLAVFLTAICAAVAGPISFVALVAPQIARRLENCAGVPIFSTALMGGVLLLVSDMIAQNIYPPSPLPVGVVTVSLGGGYFVWLLIREVRK
ncbi:FecCD family ABC transporter permease [Dermabacteraceae bacterium P13115]|nr:iron chelate uptake ABC transporter family permease subunit [Dermabacteraceae bacterium TAE3-ERU5]